LYTDINKYDSTSNIFAHHPTTTDDSTMRDLE